MQVCKNVNTDERVKWYLEHWEEEFDMDWSGIMDKSSRQIMKGYIHNHIIHRYNYLKQNGIEIPCLQKQ